MCSRKSLSTFTTFTRRGDNPNLLLKLANLSFVKRPREFVTKTKGKSHQRSTQQKADVEPETGPAFIQGESLMEVPMGGWEAQLGGWAPRTWIRWLG